MGNNPASRVRIPPSPLRGSPTPGPEGWQSGRMRRSRKPLGAASSLESSNLSPSAPLSRNPACLRVCGGTRTPASHPSVNPLKSVKVRQNVVVWAHNGRTKPPCLEELSRPFSRGRPRLIRIATAIARCPIVRCRRIRGFPSGLKRKGNSGPEGFGPLFLRETPANHPHEGARDNGIVTAVS